MKKTFAIFLMLLLAFTNLWAGEDEDPMMGFIQGSYIVVGQTPEDGKAYNGTMSIMMDEEGKLEVTRTIGGKVINCTGKMDSALGGEVTVFTITFIENKKEYEATYLISSDLDNYARLTGYVYLKEGDTQMPGLEALFPDIFGY